MKIGDKFKCKYKGEVKHGVVIEGMNEYQKFIFHIMDVVIGNHRSLKIPVSIHYTLNDFDTMLKTHEITDFELLPEDELKPDGQVYFTDFVIKGENKNAEPILCSQPTRYIVSLVFNNNKGVQNTVDVVSGVTKHDALGAAIEKNMKTLSGLIVYNIMPWEIEEDVKTDDNAASNG